MAQTSIQNNRKTYIGENKSKMDILCLEALVA